MCSHVELRGGSDTSVLQQQLELGNHMTSERLWVISHPSFNLYFGFIIIFKYRLAENMAAKSFQVSRLAALSFHCHRV